MSHTSRVPSVTSPATHLHSAPTAGQPWRSRLLLAGILAGLALHLLGALVWAQGPVIPPLTTMTGELVILHGDDFEHHRGKFVYQLKDFLTDRMFTLHFPSTAPEHLQSGVASIHQRGRGGKASGQAS